MQILGGDEEEEATTGEERLYLACTACTQTGRAGPGVRRGGKSENKSSFDAFRSPPPHISLSFVRDLPGTCPPRMGSGRRFRVGIEHPLDMT